MNGIQKMLVFLLILSVLTGFCAPVWADTETSAAADTSDSETPVGNASAASDPGAASFEVTEGELLPPIKGHYDYHPELAEFTVKRLTVEGVPLYEVYRDDGEKKPLVIFLHGGGGNKAGIIGLRNDWAYDMARAGFYCVAIDCAGSGDSEIGPIDSIPAFAMTVSQIDTLIEYYATIPQADEERFGLYGVSMGANISFAYVVYGKYRPTIICTDKGTPDYTLLADRPLYDCFDHGRNGCPNVLTREEIFEYAREYSPINRPEAFLDVYIYAGNGTADDQTGPEGCMALESLLDEAGGTKHVFNYYEGLRHGDDFPDYHPIEAMRQALLGEKTETVFQ